MKKETGFTFVEVSIILVVFSVIAGFAAPMISQWKSRLILRAETTKLFGQLNKARIVAIRSNAYVVFMYTERGYKIFVDDGSGGGKKEDWIRQPGEEMLADVTFDQQVKLVLSDSTFSLQRMRFSGSPGVKDGTVTLQGNDGSKMEVVINKIGRVRVGKR